MTRWLWRGLLAVLAVIAICAEFDRASYLRPELSVVVPPPFRSFAQSPTALLALAGGDAETARAEARRLVRRRPMPAEHLFILAMSEIGGRHPQAFANAIRAASTRGWRFAPLQTTAAQAALQAGDLTGAANRVAALWAADAGNPSVVPLTKALLEAPGGAAAFAVPLAQTRVWADNFIARAPAIVSPATALKVVETARRGGARFDCGAMQRFAEAMRASGEVVSSGALACSPPRN